MADLSVKFCNVTFPNPLILPSGIAQEIPNDHERAIRAGAGGVTVKSLTVESREGYSLPRIIKFDCGFLNAVGFRGPGIKKGKELVRQFITSSRIPVIASLFSTRLNEIKLLASELASVKPALIEIDISCPHVENEFGKSLAMGEETAFEATKVAKREVGQIPLICKLSADFPEINKVAKSCEKAGADGISAVNTIGPGIVIDIKTKKPVLGSKRGGVSGQAIRPIAVRCVYDIYEAVKIPIIGIGGVYTWQDTVEMMMAGATLVGIGSAVYAKGYKVYEEIKGGLANYMEHEKIKSLKELVGAAH